jgi:DNA-directed RNA polymerase specialized sigma24 family protein
MTSSPDETADLLQITAERALRGFTTWRGEAGFLGWCIAIASHEAWRIEHRRRRALRRKELAEAEAELTLSPEETSLALRPTFNLAQLAATTHEAGFLSAMEARVFAARIGTRPAMTLAQLSAAFGLDTAACAVHLSRAIPKLRVYMFLARPDLLGGQAEIAAAFGAAISDPRQPLTPLEEEAFRHEVLERASPLRRAGWREALRSACGKVIRYCTMRGVLQLP